MVVRVLYSTLMYMLFVLSADVFHPYNIQKALPCWKIWLWLHMGNNGCDSNKHLEAAKFDRILHEFERFVWYPF